MSITLHLTHYRRDKTWREYRLDLCIGRRLSIAITTPHHMFLQSGWRKRPEHSFFPPGRRYGVGKLSDELVCLWSGGPTYKIKSPEKVPHD